jgi:hypothetical protein
MDTGVFKADTDADEDDDETDLIKLYEIRFGFFKFFLIKFLFKFLEINKSSLTKLLLLLLLVLLITSPLVLDSKL